MLQSTRIRIAAATVLCLGGALPLAAQGAVDHGPYDMALRRYVHAGRVDYDGFARDSGFARYLVSLQHVDPTLLPPDDRLAFWINVYNAFTIDLVARSGERTSIRNLHRTFGVLRLKGPWTTPFVRAGGRTLSLEEVQHRMLRQESADARIHFALVCAAVSCPPLREEAYTGARLEEQLEDQGRRFLTNDAVNRFDVKERTFFHSMIFRNFRGAFGTTRRELGNFLATWYTDSAAQALLKDGRFQMSALPFDWTLDAIPRGGVARH